MLPHARFVIALFGVAAALSTGSSAAADCAAPDISAQPRTVAVGSQLSISGNAWGNACNDTPGPGCNPPPLGEPIRDIQLQLQNKETSEVFDLIALDANEAYGFETTVEVPDVPAGRYEIADARGEGYWVGKSLLVTDGD
jgi:hypothetical protein